MTTNQTKEFPHEYVPTVIEPHKIESDFHGKKVTLEMIEFINEEYHPKQQYAYVNISVCLVCFSVVNPRSFENVKSKWIPQALRYTSGKVPLILVGMKTELRRDPKTLQKLTEKGLAFVTYEQGEATARENMCIDYIEISTERGYGLKELNTMIMQCYGAYSDRDLSERKQKCIAQ